MSLDIQPQLYENMNISINMNKFHHRCHSDKMLDAPVVAEIKDELKN